MKLAALLLAFLLVAAPASALTIQANPKDELVVEKQWERLSPCIQENVEKAGLRRVKIVPHGKLGSWTVADDCPAECSCDGTKTYTLYAHARSILFRDVILVDAKWVTPEIVMHEFGHWFTNAVIRPNYWAAWTRALKLDIKDADKCYLYDNEYLKDPDEAAAEVFAAQFVKTRMYDASGFKRSNAMMAEILAKTCSDN